MTHPSVGPLTALAFELVIGTPERFHCGKHFSPAFFAGVLSGNSPAGSGSIPSPQGCRT